MSYTFFLFSIRLYTYYLLLRVRLDTVENWKLKLKTEKYCSKIIFKCVNSIVGPIFNEKVAEKWNLWVREQYTICCDWLKQIGKVKICGYCSLNSTWTVTAALKKLKNAWKGKKKKKEGKTQTQTPYPNVAIMMSDRIFKLISVIFMYFLLF